MISLITDQETNIWVLISRDHKMNKIELLNVESEDLFSRREERKRESMTHKTGKRA